MQVDGIIQEVFRKYFRKSGLNESPYAGYLHWTQFIDFENELIEKIKQLRDKHDKCHECSCSYCDELIGDNECE